VFQDNWSKLSRDVITDKIKGIIYGEAIGDALGLATEFMTQKEAVRYYGKDGPKEYSKIIQDFHRSRWMKGDWTDDTDQLLLILQMIVERKGSVEKCAFAEKNEQLEEEWVQGTRGRWWNGDWYDCVSDTVTPCLPH
jgi:ADP-ribosylglycohydrolase